MQEILQKYKELQDIIAILGMDELSEDDKLVVSQCQKDPEIPVTAILRSGTVYRYWRANTCRLQKPSADFRDSGRQA